METHHQINNLGDLLQLPPNKKLVNYKTKQLTQAGENYGSLMLALDVTIEDSDNSQEVHSMVAKLSPPNEWIKQMFNIPVTFKKENSFYHIIVPTLQQFQKEEGVEHIMDIFPKCYGSRINLNNSDVVDNDAVLLLENLKVNGFVTVDCMKGFDLETTKIILKDLAVFHAVPVAYKIKHPQKFQEKLMPYLQKNQNFESVSEEIAQGMIDGMVNVVKSVKESAHLEEATRNALKRGTDYYKNRQPPEEPYATISHNDYWVNNTMIKFDGDNKPVKNKMVDFQLLEYASPANDIIFFLFSSVQKGVLDNNYDDFINLYYKTFIDTLEELHCDTTPFTMELLQKELVFYAKYLQFFHVMLMMKPIYSLRDKVKELSEMTEADMIDTGNMSELYPIRIADTVLGFAERNWL